MRNYILLICCFFLLNCNKSENLNKNEVAVNAKLMDVIQPENSDKLVPPPPMSESDQIDEKSNLIPKKIIKNGYVEIEVSDIKNSQTKISESLKKFNAYIQTENFQNTDFRDELRLTIRVPHQNFEPLISSLSSNLGSLVSKEISSDDVTEEYTDVSIKLANKKIYLEKYRDLLKRANSTKDLMEIQEKIRGLEDEIDVSEGRLKFIDDRVNLSTLDLSLFKEKSRDAITSKIGFGSRFFDSLAQGWNNFVGFFLGLISFWPFLLIIPFIIFLWRKWKNRKK
ncbi:DUF4349 domain-containing protein [Halpernia frigidisoli]|uniref:DUF4349 domain-containing protein n=1 Tax=Halpernia frigidisoli TaxID=1125876 RepID=A0A1I3DQX3_9FLAO|nr:DUF4349 domain-containing protein [Halpernia frigidisoli]SFH89137.1 protein of unknown function [Halpernia frigidisoli]